MTNEEIGLRISYRRNQLGLTMDDVAKKIGVARSTIQRYEKGTIEKIKLPVIESIASALSVNPNWIIGNTDDPTPITKYQAFPHAANIIPMPQMQKIPLVGTIACGTPILADENIEDYIDLPRHIHADYALTCKGDSMVNAGIRDGDVVYIRKQDQVDNGQIAAVLVGDDEATLKRFYFDGKMIQLVAENPAYSPKVFYGEEMQEVHVIGLAIAYTHAIQ